VGVSIERLTHDRYKWRGEDIANINTVAQRYAQVQGPISQIACAAALSCFLKLEDLTQAGFWGCHSTEPPSPRTR
jgi:hypothetical protein